MQSPIAIALSLGLLGGCTLYIDDRSAPGQDDTADPTPVTPPLPSPTDTPSLLAEWSGCMSLANFTAAGMAPAWSAPPASTSKCTTCHIAASTLFPISSDADAMFKVISEHSIPMLGFFTLDRAIPPGKVIVNPNPFKSVATGLPPNEQHPRFSVDGASITALAKFYDATVARMAAGTCDPPRLKD